MTDQNTPAAEAVDAIYAQAMDRAQAFMYAPNGKANTRNLVESSLAAHTTYLWERAMQPDVVEAAARAWFQSLGLTNCDIEWNDDRGGNLTNDEYSAWETELVDVEEFIRGTLWIELPCGGKFHYEDFKYLFGSTAALTLLLGPRPEGDTDAN